MAVRPSTFATSVSWRELEMTETETWQTFEKIKQKNSQYSMHHYT